MYRATSPCVLGFGGGAGVRAQFSSTAGISMRSIRTSVSGGRSAEQAIKDAIESRADSSIAVRCMG